MWGQANEQIPLDWLGTFSKGIVEWEFTYILSSRFQPGNMGWEITVTAIVINIMRILKYLSKLFMGLFVSSSL